MSAHPRYVGPRTHGGAGPDCPGAHLSGRFVLLLTKAVHYRWTVAQLICLSDLENDFINPYDLTTRLNRFVVGGRQPENGGVTGANSPCLEEWMGSYHGQMGLLDASVPLCVGRHWHECGRWTHGSRPRHMLHGCIRTDGGVGPCCWGHTTYTCARGTLQQRVKPTIPGGAVLPLRLSRRHCCLAPNPHPPATPASPIGPPH